MNTNRQLHQQIQDLLLGLGSCRTEVAETLRRLGVRARPKDAQGCAIALYLKAVLGADRRVRSLDVKNSGVTVRIDGSRRWSRSMTIALPEPAREFIVAFDEAVYPDLIRDEMIEARPQPGATTG